MIYFKNILFIQLVFILFSTILFSQNNTKMETATFGTGCFWCTEAIFDRVEGVIEVLPGYSGGTDKNPNYKLICSGTTKYAEVVQIKFNPEIISFDELLEIFWSTHNPTTLNRQGADVGPQYRSVIFYHNENQKEKAELYKQKLLDAKVWGNPIVTEISPFVSFYEAEKEHLDFYKDNPANGYCNFVITPKVEKFEKVFSNKLKKE